MRKSMILINSVLGGIVLALVAAAATLLYLMFSSDGDSDAVHRTGLFGAVSFDTEPAADGGLGITMGIANPTTMAIIALVCIIALAWFQVVYVRVKDYRKQLLDHGVSPS